MRPLRILLFNLATDADHQVLGFTTQWINALAPYCAQLDVVTMVQGRLAVVDGVRVFSVGKERGYSEAHRALEFYRVVAHLLATQAYDVCFAHMMPLFAVMGSPLLRLKNIPIVLWYTHRQQSRVLAWAERVSWRVVTAVPSSFPIPTPKLRPLGHGIDTAFYTPPITPLPTHPLITQVARLTTIKHQHVLLESTHTLDVEVVLIGDVNADDDAYKARLINLAQDPTRQQGVMFTGVLPPETVREWYGRTHIAVNLSPIGLFDKSALESMACGVPTIVCNPAFDEVLGDYAPLLRIQAPDDRTGLQRAIQAVLALSTAERQAIGHTLRQGVMRLHSLPTLITRLVSVLATGEIADA